MSILAEIYHLQPLPRYGYEKPYTLRYVPDGDVPISNVAREKHIVEVKDLRNNVRGYSLDKHGFAILNLAFGMSHEDYNNHEKIMNVYLPTLEQELLKYLPGSTIDFVSYFIRKREVSFPYSTGQNYTYGQPNIVAHVDATSDDLVRQVQRRYLDRSIDLLKDRCQYITVWKPLRGPLYDYPLALCDFSSLNPEEDLEPQDIVDKGEVLENSHLYHRPEHQWYYLSGQRESEALVFRQADTRWKRFGTPHCAINDLNAPEDRLPRESIEVVAFVFTPD